MPYLPVYKDGDLYRDNRSDADKCANWLSTYDQFEDYKHPNRKCLDATRCGWVAVPHGMEWYTALAKFNRGATESPEPPCGGVVPDPIASPPHYTSAVETIDAIEAWSLNYRLGNVVKYISRAGKKDPSKRLEDLLKARWYLEREINKEESK
jgi:hypothetical protein